MAALVWCAYESEAWGKPRDERRLPPPLGNGYWSQEIYYHLLNCGLRLPPSAGSASGVLPNPVGYNRVYVHTGPDLSYEKWWRNMKAGQSCVTNGPFMTALQALSALEKAAGGSPSGGASQYDYPKSRQRDALADQRQRENREIEAREARERLRSAEADAANSGLYQNRANERGYLEGSRPPE